MKIYQKFKIPKSWGLRTQAPKQPQLMKQNQEGERERG